MDTFAFGKERLPGMGLAGPALVHVRHQQEAERRGEGQIAAAKESLQLLREHSAHNRELSEWLGAWDAQENGTVAGDEQSRAAIAETLLGFIDAAKKWKSEQSEDQ